MYILSGKKSGIWFFLIGLIFITNSYVSAQINPINIAITVMPPYTSAIADYVYTPNKIVATISNTSLTGGDIDLYLRGSIISDGGIEIKTSKSYKPTHSIHLSPGMVYSLTPDNIENMFAVNSLDVKGIDLMDLTNGAGLPEDNYQICIRAYDYFTNQPISNEEPLGCSNYFMVTNLEPPMITMPFCGDSINVHLFQNVMVSWTIPAGAISSQYKFEMIEIPDNINIDPNNAFQSSAFTPFYEEVVTANIINLTADKVLLTPGYTYAFRVQAFDPFNKFNFRNAGYSEVCYFVCKDEEQINISDDNEYAAFTENTEALKEQFEFIPSTVISGRLLAKFPDDPNSGILTGSIPSNTEPIVVDPPSQNVDLNLPSSSSGTQIPNKSENNNQNGYSFSEVTKVSSAIGSNSESITSSFGGSCVVSEENISTGMYQRVERKPYYYFGQTEEIVNTKPLANVKIRLVARFAAHTGGAELGIGHPEYRDPYINERVKGITDLNGDVRNPGDVLNVVLATATTEESGDFTFTFNSNFFTGKSAVTATSIGHFEEDKYLENPLDELGWGMDELFQGVNFNDLVDVLNQQIDEEGLSQVTTSPQNSLGATATHNNTTLAGNELLNQASQQHAGGQQAMSYTSGKESNYGAYICLKIEVVNEKFCSPDVDIFAMPGDVLEVPTQVAKLKTYNLKVVAKASNDRNQTAVADEPMDNVRVHLLRKKENVDNELKLIIDYEGQKLKTQTHTNGLIFKDVAIDTSGANTEAYTYFKNLVKHAHFDPQYFIELSTRNLSDAEDNYEFTRYNYETQLKELKTVNENDATFISSSSCHVVYNNDFVVPEIEYSYTLNPLDPEIKGRIMAKTNFQNTGVENVRVELYNQIDSNQTYTSADQFRKAANISWEAEDTSSDVGIFRFDNLPITENNFGDVMGPFRRLYISHPSYKSVTRPIPGFKPYNLSLGMLKDIKDINLEPADTIYGYVVDEDGNAVSAYVKTSNSPFYVTYSYNFLGTNYAYFTLPSVHHYNVITIHPKSSQYFKRDTILKVAPNKRFKVVVYKKLHRPKIIVVGPLGIPVQGVIVELGEQDPETTDSHGIVEFKYASPGNQTIIKIKPPGNFAPMQVPMDIPVTASDTVIKFKLEYAKSVQGKVKEQGSNTPIHNAVVYAELENTDGTILYIETLTDLEGNYKLNGIPKSLNSIEVFAVRKGNNPSYIGASKTVTFPQNSSNPLAPQPCSFELRRMDDWDLSSIWGFPAVITGFRPSKSKTDEYLIDGYFYNPPAVEGLAMQQSNVKLAFKFIPVKKSSSGKIEPIESGIDLDVNQIPLLINETFSGNLFNHKQNSWNGYTFNSYGLHQITKQESKATLQGILKLNLSSFNFAYNFNGELFAGNKGLGNKVEAFSKEQVSDINLVTVGAQGQAEFNPQAVAKETPTNINQIAAVPKLEIFSLNSSLQPVPIQNYQVFGFNATSRMDASYLIGDKISIQTVLHTDIPTCKTCSNLDLKILAGNIVITKNNIELVELPYDTLNFQLEEWKVYNKGEWYFDKNEEAIVLEKALIVTGKSINATAKNLKIKPTTLGEGEIDMTDGGLSLGGIAKITLNGDLKPLFNYDPIGHYRISLVGSIDMDIPAGTVEKLPAMNNNERIEFESIGLLSDGTDILTINKKFRFYEILDIEVSQIVSGNGYFDLQGLPVLGIPDLIPQETAMRYMLDAQGNIVPELQPIKGGIIANGHVYFSLDQERLAQSIKKKEYTGYGTLFVSPDGDPDDSRAFTLRGQLIKTPDECKIEVFPVDQNGKYRGSIPQKMQVGSNTILVEDGLLNTSNNRWDSLVYSGNTIEIEGLNKPGKAKNKLTFVVYGAVDVSSSDIQVTNIDVGVGKLKMVFNFDDASMKGTLEMKNVPLGPAFINQGEMTVSFDKNGFYFVVASESLILGTAGEFKGGFILGSTNRVAPEDIACFTDNFKVNLPAFTTQGIKGMYVIGEKIILNKTIDLFFVKASAEAGMGLYVNTDFSSSPTFLIGGYGHAMIKGEASFEELGVTVCDVGACLSAYFNIEAGYEQGSIVMKNCASISASGYSSGLCTAPLQAIGVDPSLSFSISANYGYISSKGFYTELNLGGSCVSGNNSNNSDVCGE